LACFALAASVLTFSAVASAQPITFATGQGTDSAACGADTSPCRTLQQAVNNAPAGGYVVLQGPADFGPAEVQKSLSIMGENGATVRAKNSGLSVHAIVIHGDANSIMRLRGLTLEGILGSKASASTSPTAQYGILASTGFRPRTLPAGLFRSSIQVFL
jgi:hypothetical protein